MTQKHTQICYYCWNLQSFTNYSNLKWNNKTPNQCFKMNIIFSPHEIQRTLPTLLFLFEPWVDYNLYGNLLLLRYFKRMNWLNSIELMTKCTHHILRRTLNALLEFDVLFDISNMHGTSARYECMVGTKTMNTRIEWILLMTINMYLVDAYEKLYHIIAVA